MEKEGFIAALLPFCDTVCEYDKRKGKLRVRKTGLVPDMDDRWHTVEELSKIFRESGGVTVEKEVWTHYLSEENLKSFFKKAGGSFRMRFRQGGVGYRQYDIRVDRIDANVLVISGRDTQEQELDALTGALSRNHYQRDMCGEVFRGGVAIIDMDDLKLYNDVYGHSAGDRALRLLADTVCAAAGPTGMLVRYGGDEFLLLMPDIGEREFTALLGDVQRRLQMAVVPGCDGQHPTASIGCVMAQQEKVSDAVARADRLMYRAKRKKNTVVTEKTPAGAEKQEGTTVLVVDDSAMNRAMLREMLGEELHILEAGNGSECMEMLDRYGADIALVLLDMIMPVMDGLQVLEAMNGNGYIDKIPVVMITADDSEEKMRQAYELGVTDYIERPFNVQVVRRRVMNTVKLYARQRRLLAVMQQQMRRQERTMSVVADILSRVMGYRNGEGVDHGRHVEQITGRLLERLLERTDRYHITRQECQRAAAAAMFHDIGKMGVPDTLLHKPEALTPEEFSVVKRHTLIGEELLLGMEDFKDEPLVLEAARICRGHHERVDGRGYPDGKRGDEIPITVQAAGLADAYDALVSQRSYKPAYSHGEALDMIRRGACGAFLPLLVDCLQDIQPSLLREIYGLQEPEQ